MPVVESKAFEINLRNNKKESKRNQLLELEQENKKIFKIRTNLFNDHSDTFNSINSKLFSQIHKELADSLYQFFTGHSHQKYLLPNLASTCYQRLLYWVAILHQIGICFIKSCRHYRMISNLRLSLRAMYRISKIQSRKSSINSSPKVPYRNRIMPTTIFRSWSIGTKA